jgi:diaminohydroxyphosphoribosylaminopyrimidine deaminase/5-amino-6-(5-phosphoribosylamino)uracil reductase
VGCRAQSKVIKRLMQPEPTEPDDILAPIRQAPAGLPYVVAQLGQSLDGRIATPSGASQWINGAGALDHLHRLRAAVDAVVVGCGTVIADDPRLNVRRVAGRDPARVVIDRGGRVPHGARIFADNGARRIVLRSTPGEVPAGVECLLVPEREGSLDPSAIVAALAAAGLNKILIEGGAATVSRFIDAGAVDRLHMLLSPVIIGSGVQGLSLAPIERLDQARRPRTRVHILDDGDVLFDCDFRQQSEG